MEGVSLSQEYLVGIKSQMYQASLNIFLKVDIDFSELI